jgi:hypothetical protein
MEGIQAENLKKIARIRGLNAHTHRTRRIKKETKVEPVSFLDKLEGPSLFQTEVQEQGEDKRKTPERGFEYTESVNIPVPNADFVGINCRGVAEKVETKIINKMLGK